MAIVCLTDFGDVSYRLVVCLLEYIWYTHKKKDSPIKYDTINRIQFRKSSHHTRCRAHWTHTHTLSHGHLSDTHWLSTTAPQSHTAYEHCPNYWFSCNIVSCKLGKRKYYKGKLTIYRKGRNEGMRNFKGMFTEAELHTVWRRQNSVVVELPQCTSDRRMWPAIVKVVDHSLYHSGTEQRLFIIILTGVVWKNSSAS